MPNWCANRLSVNGSTQQIEAVKAMCLRPGEAEIDFSVAVPEPAGLEGEALVTWRRRHWGSKWNAQVGASEELDGEWRIHFDTANTPPKPWFRSLAARTTARLELASAEPGCLIGLLLRSSRGELETQAYDDHDGVASLIDEYGLDTWLDMPDEEETDEKETDEDEEARSEHPREDKHE